MTMTMNNTYLKLTEDTNKRLIELLESVPMNKRDIIWNQLNKDLLKSKNIWEAIKKKRKLLNSKVK